MIHASFILRKAFKKGHNFFILIHDSETASNTTHETRVVTRTALLDEARKTDRRHTGDRVRPEFGKGACPLLGERLNSRLGLHVVTADSEPPTRPCPSKRRLGRGSYPHPRHGPRCAAGVRARATTGSQGLTRVDSRRAIGSAAHPSPRPWRLNAMPDPHRRRRAAGLEPRGLSLAVPPRPRPALPDTSPAPATPLPHITPVLSTGMSVID